MMPTALKNRPEIARGLAELITAYLDEQLAQPREQIKSIDRRVDNLEQKWETEGLSRSQARKVQKTVATRVHEVAKAMGDESAAQHFANIYGSLKDKYNVGSYMDIPRDRFLEVIDLVKQYDGSGRFWWRT